jgi:hypothetical protein
MIISPREAYLEAENTNLREKIKYLEADARPFKTYLLQDEPEILNVPDITETLHIASIIHIEDMGFRYHIVARSTSGRNVKIGYYVDRKTLEAGNPTAAINAILGQLRNELIKLSS